MRIKCDKKNYESNDIKMQDTQSLTAMTHASNGIGQHIAQTVYTLPPLNSSKESSIDKSLLIRYIRTL